MNLRLFKFHRTSVFFILLAVVTCCGPSDSQQSTVWPEQTKETRPWSRFWWMGSAVNHDDLALLMEKYAKAGLGGLEITPIYGARGYEEQYLEFLSDKWMEMLHFTISEAGKHGMGVDMNLGTGWPYGGVQITPAHAARRLIFSKYHLREGEALSGNIAPVTRRRPGDAYELLALRAFQGNQQIDLLDKVNSEGYLEWVPGQGDWEIVAAFSQNTRQMVKRAAPGGEGLTVDPFSSEALEIYLRRFEEAFGDKPPGIRSVFNDSYEFYGANFSPTLFDEFPVRRGYDLRNHLLNLSSAEPDDTGLRILADYRQTLSDMLLENFTMPWDQWANSRNSLSRLQAHGSPGNLLDLYAAADIPEGETFGSTRFDIEGYHKYTDDQRNIEPDPVMLKFSSSAGNTTGKPLISSETFTWLGEHFQVPLSECKPELEQVFLAGVNHVFFHGTSYSPEEAGWPGWLFYASVHFSPSNSFWPHLNGLNEYIARCQSILQSGKSDNELIVYWPVQDLWHRPGNMDMQLTVHNIKEWLFPSAFYQTVNFLMKSGYSMDFISDRQIMSTTTKHKKMVTSPVANPYQVLIVPKTRYIPLSTLEHILKLAKDGATVIFTGIPEDVPGFHEATERKEKLMQLLSLLSFSDAGNGIRACKTGRGLVLLSEDVQAALESAGIYREKLVDAGLKFIRRSAGKERYYFLVNHTAETIDQTISINAASGSVIILDPQDGSYGLASSSKNARGGTGVRIQVPSGQSLFLKASPKKYPGISNREYDYPAGEALTIEGPWELQFTAGGPALPGNHILKNLVSWTTLPAKEATYFSGAAIYTTQFELPEKTAGEYMLRLGQVCESARVRINGHDAGLLWSVPHQAKVGKYLKEGTNAMEIEVVNLMANRIIYMDREGIPWRNFREINFVNLAYRPFDASDWEPMPSGLLGPVTLVPLNNQ